MRTATNHPNLINLISIDWGEGKDEHDKDEIDNESQDEKYSASTFLIFDYREGIELKKLIQAGNITSRNCKKIAAQLLDIYQYCIFYV